MWPPKCLAQETLWCGPCFPFPFRTIRVTLLWHYPLCRTSLSLLITPFQMLDVEWEKGRRDRLDSEKGQGREGRDIKQKEIRASEGLRYILIRHTTDMAPLVQVGKLLRRWPGLLGHPHVLYFIQIEVLCQLEWVQTTYYSSFSWVLYEISTNASHQSQRLIITVLIALVSQCMQCSLRVPINSSTLIDLD